MEIRWDRLDTAAWQEALPPDACAMQQSWRYGAAVAAHGRHVCRAEIRTTEGRALAQTIIRRAGPVTAGYLPRGPVGVCGPEILSALHRTLPGHGLRLLIVAPETETPGLLPLVTPQTHAELVLTEAATMRRRMHGKWRNRLSRAEEAKLKITVTTPSRQELQQLADLDRAQSRARGYCGLPPAFLSAWSETPGPPPQLFSARQRGETIATMLFLDHPPGVTYQLGWSGDAGRAVSAHNLLLWRAMLHFAGRGRRRLDLGTLDTVTAPGLARFKLGTGATVRRLGSTGLVLPWRPSPQPSAGSGSTTGTILR
ncbi:GNAT family N-acetyltransferase [Pseudoruegeria sp. HB172150]|uniref:GNAT family N-acetyltransferase n=1 Tax=Pseudoruegeria sp. HB172150 TaxID=2721164 RepID=UPI00155335E6|nr:GNAT family N-acetyltransferase [Pseudoruegeria sp. HB172150]